MPCLRMYLKSVGEFLVEEDHGLAIHHSVLRASEREHIHACVSRNLFETRIETHSGIRNASAVNMKQHVVVVSEAGECLQFFLRVDRAHFGGLRDGDHARLHVMFVAKRVQERF